MAGTKFGGSIKLEGADAYKADLANINSNLKLLTKEMQTYGATVQDLTQKTHLYNAKVNAQKRHIKEIEDALEQAKQKYGEYSDEVQKWYAKLNNAEAVLIDMERELKQAQQELDAMSSKFKQTADKLASVGEGLKSFGDKISGLSAGAAAAVTGIAALGIKSAAAADDLNTLSAVTGITTDELQKFAYASELIDVSQETITGSLRKLTNNMNAARNGSEKQTEAFKTLGIAYTDSSGKLRDNSEVFYDIIDALGKVENETERDALAMALFGKSAQDLNPLIKAGSDELKRLGKEAEDAGLILSQDMLDDMNKLNDGVDKLKAILSADFNRLGANIAPALIPVLEDITAAVGRIMDKLGGLDSKTIETGLKIGAFVAVLAPLSKALGGILTTIGSITAAAPALMAALPAVAAITATTAAIAGLIAVGNEFEKVISGTTELTEEERRAIEDLGREVERNRDKLETQTRAYESEKGAIQDSLDAKRADISVMRDMIPRMEELAGKTDRTAAENQELNDIIGRLNDNFPDLGLAIDGTTGKLNKQTDAIYDTINAYEKLAEAQAYQKQYEAAATNRANLIIAKNNTVTTAAEAYSKLSDENKEALSLLFQKMEQGKEITDEYFERLVANAIPNTLLAMESDPYLETFLKSVDTYQDAYKRMSGAIAETNKAKKDYEKFISDNKTQQRPASGGRGTPAGKVNSTQDLSDNVKAGLETWQYRYDAGIISTEEYIAQLTRIRDTYFAEDSKAWREYNLKIINLQKGLDSQKGKTAATAAKNAAKETAKGLEKDAKETIEALKKAYSAEQSKSYDWIGERVYKGDFADFGTTANESYERIYQRAREAFNAGIINIDELADEADRIRAAKLNDYGTEKQKLTNFIDDRKFYDDWNKVNTTEEKVLQQMLDNADRYYAEGILDYKQYAEEVRQINRSIFSAQAAEQESVFSLAQDRIEKQLSEKKTEIDRQTAALNAQVSELRAKYTTEDRRKRMAELKEEISDYQNAVTLKGQEHLKSLQDEAEKLRREQEIEDLQKRNNEIITQLEAEYKALETEKTSLLTKIADNTAELNKFTAAVAGISESVSTAVQTTLTKIIQDNSVQNNYNTNNASQYVTAAQGVDVQAIMSAFTRGLKG